MDRKKPSRKQQDLFWHNPENMQWENLPETNRQDTKLLLSQLLFYQHQLTRENHHAVEDYT